MFVSDEERQVYADVFESRKLQAKTVQIDDNMRTLIETLNQLPGIATEACCGGHENPARDQRPAGEWFVTIEVYRLDERGWDDLERIRRAMSQFGGAIVIEFTYATSSFFLKGKNVEPDAFASVIQNHISTRF